MTGRIATILPEQSGTSSRGSWNHQDFVIEYSDGKYTSKAHFALWGDKTKILEGVSVGDTVTVSFDYSSRESGGRWYDEGRAWKIEKAAEVPDASFSPDLPQR